MANCAIAGIVAGGIAALVPHPVRAFDERPAARVRAAYTHFERGKMLSVIGGPLTPRFKSAYRVDTACEEKIQDQHWRGSIFVSGQDFKVSNVSVSTENRGESALQVTVRFKQFGKADSRVFLFARAGDDWALDDVLFAGRSLRAAMNEPCPKI